MSSKVSADSATKRGSSERREEIIRIAAKMFAERGFTGTTIRDIGQSADILSGSLYHHFRSKESIANEILSAYWRDLLELIDEVGADDSLDAPTRIRELIRISAIMFEKHESGVRMLVNDWTYVMEFMPDIDDHMAHLERVWTSVLEQGVRDGTVRSDLDPALTYRIIMSSISGMCRWYRPGGKIPIEQIFETLAAVFLAGIEEEA